MLLYLILGTLLVVTLLLWRVERRVSRRRKCIQQKLFLQRLYTDVIDLIPYSISQKKRGTDGVSWRNAFGKQTYSKEEFKNESYEDCHFVSDYREVNVANLKKMGESDHLFSDEHFNIENPVKGLKQVRHLDGRVDYFDSYKYVIRYHNEVYIIMVDIPITELILTRKRMEEHSRLESNFLANMSNDIDASLDKIWSACQSVIDAGKDEELGEYIDVLVTNISIFLKRINDIISLSEVESSAIEHYDVAKLEVISLLLEQQVKLENQLKVLKKDANIEIEFLEAYQKMLVYQDKGHFTQIMDNLLSNAAKCTTFGSIKFGVIAGLNYYLFFVKDTGIGISQERIEMLFSGDDEVKDSSVDFALGLSISKKIVMTQQGQIGMISDKDDGSLFWVFFPYSATFELGAVSDDEKRELYLITEKIIRCDELNGLNLENPF